MRPTSELKATSVREMQRPDVQSRMRVWFQDKAGACLWPQTDCEIPIEP